ncbi:nitrous oxide reductase family maturation protein NosD [Halorubrum halodurans]|uniref:Copper-binding protein n=1 Tax=Halorubrum halodurans TaxID=1383851 RepID=A0A256IT47_9EURY|nr:nitrous oxide reductase family maturation protein NosD [Halorubrum halodurans]OYR59312.1 copper-binding protein [Halorubrum halodurans]
MSRLRSLGGVVSTRAVALATLLVLVVVLGGTAAAVGTGGGASAGLEGGSEAVGGEAVEGEAIGSDPADATNVTDALVDVDADEPDRPTEPGAARVVPGSTDASADSAAGESETYDDLAAAVDAAGPGAVVEVSGVFEPAETVVLDEPNVTVRGAGAEAALIDGGGEDTVLAVRAANVTVEGIRIHDSGEDLESEDAGVFLAENADGAVLADLYLSDVAFGVWVNGADRIVVRDSRIEGTENPRFVDRGNGINLWETTGSAIRNNEITGVRDGIYFSWASDVETTGNALWDLRYGVHYMYSDDNRLADNVAVGNDVGYALMVSEGVEATNNTAVANRGRSGHGILLKEIEDSVVRGNDLVANDRGLFLYNAQHNEVRGNLVYANGVGVHHSADTQGTVVVGNDFVGNGEQVLTTTRELLAWNGSARGNYWSDARVADSDGDGIGEARHRPAGAAERLVQEHPSAAVFANGPAFDAIRLVESRFPVVETAGVVDHRPLASPSHDLEPYRPYAAAVDPAVEYDDDPGDRHH